MFLPEPVTSLLNLKKKKKKDKIKKTIEDLIKNKFPKK